MNGDYILLLLIAASFAALIGFGGAKLMLFIQKRTEIKKAKQILSGQKANNALIEGEKIRISRFRWKTQDGKLKSFEIPKIKPSGAFNRQEQ